MATTTPDVNTIAQDSGFIVPEQKSTMIKIIGVGGGGNNAVNYMYSQKDIEGVSFVVLNTDNQALMNSPVPCKVLVGDGNGAGNKPDVGREKAETDKEKIEALFDNGTKMVFITAGMGGGTGTGAGPVVARLAQERDILTVGIITIPFVFEGKKKILKALDGAEEMAKHVDALLIINNEQLVHIFPDLNWLNAFSKADDILAQAARSISELITYNGKWNVDFEDVNTTLRNGGPAIISTGTGTGEHRVTQALENALESPLLKKHDVFSAKRLLVNIYYNPEAQNPLVIGEADEVTQFMANFSNDHDIITGQTIDPSLGDEVNITVLASGFDMTINMPDGKASRIISKDDNAKDDNDRIAEAYGNDVGGNITRAKDEKQYIILRPEDMDNDEILRTLRETPAYRRPANAKTHINDLRNGNNESEEGDNTLQATNSGHTLIF